MLAFQETLTGFKWMGNVSHDLLQQSKTVLFAFEEAIGFMNGSEVESVVLFSVLTTNQLYP